jgi:hypothetical protein
VGTSASTGQRISPVCASARSFPDLFVKLDGSLGSIERGLIEVSTLRYRKLVKDHEARQPAK